MIVLDLSILNQKGTPMFNSDLTANRPAAGIVGRIFIAIDSPYGIFRDTGSGWDQISAGSGVSTNIYNSDGTLTANRTISSGGYSLTFNPQTTFSTTNTADPNLSSFATISVNTTTFGAGFSANNIGSIFGAIGEYNLQTFAGSATFANSNIAANLTLSSIDFSSAGATITMTQSTGLRVMSASQSQMQYQGTNSGTITHAAVTQNLGFYRPSGATGILTITNAYSHLINALDDYGAGFTFTNRWGIYQAGSSDVNYFAAIVKVGSASTLLYDSKFQLTGDAYITGVLRETITKHRDNASSSLQLSYHGKLIEMNVATANTLTIPIAATSLLPIGAKIDVTQYGAGQTQIVAASGVTLHSAGGATKLRVQYSGATLIQADTNVWYLFGDITT